MGDRTSALGWTGGGTAGDEGTGVGGGMLAGRFRAMVAGGTVFLAFVDLAGDFWVGALVFFPGIGAGEGEEVEAPIGEAGGRGVRLRGAGVGAVGTGIEVGRAGAGAGGIDSTAGTALERARTLGGEDFDEGGVFAETGAAAGAGVLVGALIGRRLDRRTGASGLAGTAPGTVAGDGGVGTGSFFPVRGERDLGGMSRTLREADYRLGIRLRLSLNWLSQAAQTVFPKVHIWWIGEGEGLER